MTIDFDKAFERYAAKWFKAHADECADPCEMEEQVPRLYDKWADRPDAAAGGLSPRAYFARVTRPEELLRLLEESCKGENNPCSLLLDRIADCPECADGLKKLVAGGGVVKLKATAVNLLTELGAAHPLDVYVGWITDGGIDDDLRELGVEVLDEHADEVSERLFGVLPDASAEQKKILAEILVNADKDERTYALLTELFASGDNLPLYAGYLGKYGDERAAAMLYRALDSCNYLEYIEIKNAIERMGGVVDDSRDFSEDAFYKAIKNLK